MMKKFFKRAALCFAPLFCAGVVLSLIFRLYLLLAVLLLLAALLAVDLYGMVQYLRYARARTINPRVNLKRDWGALVLGRADQRVSFGADALDFRGEARNRYVDFLLLQRYYGFLKKDGEVIISLSRADRSWWRKEKISLLDRRFLHEVTLMQNGIEPKGRKEKAKLIFMGYVYLFHRFKNRFAKKYDRLPSEEMKERLAPMQAFCKERGISIRFV